LNNANPNGWSKSVSVIGGNGEVMNGDAILAELRRVDETTLRFSSWGFGGRLEPSSSARLLSESLTHAALVDAVPEDIRRNFERARRLFLYGLLEYDFFSAAYDLGHLALEGALRHRFVTYYDGQVPIWRDDVVDVLAAPSFDVYYDALAAARKQRQKLRLRENDVEGLPRGYTDLYAWARRRDLLIGQRNVGVFGSLVKLRNDVAHPERHRVDMPPAVIGLLRDIAEIINRLWGRDTEGGRLFPTPIRRRPRAAALAPDRQAAVTYGSLPLVAAERGESDWTHALFLAADGEELIEFDWERPGCQRFMHTTGFQMTQYPTELLWGPGSWAELVAVLDAYDDKTPTDAVTFLDRLFYIRVIEGEHRPEFPRSAAGVVALDLDDESAIWYAVRADFPMDAWTYVRDLGEAGADRLNHASVIARLVGDQHARRHATASRDH
jgi:hypothetical protein